MTRRAPARIDANQPEIVAVFRKLGCSVQSLAAVGDGVPDLIVSLGYQNVLVEIKDGTKPPSARKLTPEQVKWHAKWRGRIEIVTSVDEAVALVGSMARNAA